jgi:hypothetical protein
VPIDAEDWDGTWLGDAGDEPVRLQVVDSAKGVLRISEIEGDGGERRWKHSYLFLRTVARHEDWDDPLILRRLDENLTLCRTPYTMAGCATKRD